MIEAGASFRAFCSAVATRCVPDSGPKPEQMRWRAWRQRGWGAAGKEIPRQKKRGTDDHPQILARARFKPRPTKAGRLGGERRDGSNGSGAREVEGGLRSGGLATLAPRTLRAGGPWGRAAVVRI